MESSFIANALQVNFDSVFDISDNDGMVQMFRALSGLRGFLGCPSVFYEKELGQFFDTALVKNGEILCVIHGKSFAITEDKFAGAFELPTEALIDLSEVPQNLVFDARSIFSKSVTVKAGSFDAVTQERFLMMTAIHFGVKVNWSKLLFEIIKEMADKSTKRAKGFAAQICVLLKGDPAVTLGEAKTFPPLKILSAKTVNTYVATNKTIDARGEYDEPEVAKVEIVGEKAVSKKRPATASDAPVVKKKKTTTGKAATAEKDLTLVVVAQEAVPIHIVEPISDMPAECPHASKRKAPKRKLRFPTGSDDEIVEQEPAVETVVVKNKGTTSVDDVDNIIEQASATRSDDIAIDDTERSIAVNDEDDDIDGAENEISRTMTSDTAPKQFLIEPLISGEDEDISGFKQSTKSRYSLAFSKSSSSSDSSMHFNTDDIPLGADIAVEHILMPTTAAPATDLTEQFAQLWDSISQLYIKQMRTQSSIGNLQNHLLSKIDDLEKASADARTQQDQELRGIFKSVRQEVQVQKIALSFEVLEFKKYVRAQSGIFTTELADIRKEIKDQKAELSKEFDDRLAAIRNDVLEFRVETQEQLTTLCDTLAQIMAYINRGSDDKKGENGGSQGRAQPPPEDRSKPGSGYGGSGSSRSEPSRKRGSSGSRQRDWRYWLS
ncbi:splicing factor 3B subunit 1-like [Dorcoceras hygrometricum]|uniref:Splicing factor 3B subunit 1-like n=1 Tax=Dorcoceras hygrometricum TaxID=472368 RepID=A0A2Z7BEH6_9LAMI|nr:splicing factor 3B subunit 1-like [Dorcoceras hygrometricum]